MKISRRTMLSIMGGAGLLSTLPCAFSTTTENLIFRHLKIPVANIEPRLAGFKMAFVSDIHYGEAMSEEFLHMTFLRLAETEIDLLVIGGDYMWIPHSMVTKSYRIVRNRKFTQGTYKVRTNAIMKECAAIMSMVKPRYGAYACLGNHDHWHSAALCVHELTSNNIRPLVNDCAVINHNGISILLGGVDDYLTGFPSLPEQLKADQSTFSILLSHNPEYVIRWVESYGHLPANLTLCGHTHGGQLRYPGTGFSPFCNVSDRRFMSGITQIGDRFNITSVGLGVVELPIRIACPPEVVFITFSADTIDPKSSSISDNNAIISGNFPFNEVA
jgi:predicted MPP superfamily phosphohydrolase